MCDEDEDEDEDEGIVYALAREQWIVPRLGLDKTQKHNPNYMHLLVLPIIILKY